MATLSMPIRRRNIIPVVLGLAILMAVIQWKPLDQVHHSVEETLAARECLGKNGTIETWSEITPWCDEHLHLLTQDKDGNIFDVIIRRIKGQLFREVTSFKPNPSGEGNSLEVIQEWLGRKEAIRIK